MTKVSFPEGFLWGVATSSYQVEGAANEGGRGESIWDRFSRKPGAVEDGTNGDVACDHYHRFPDDIRLMKDLGVKAYRFSVAWPRIQPTGTGKANPAGVDFYNRLVDGLLEAGIRPFVTLFHWDLPQGLEDTGGWPARSTAEAFKDYADIVSRALGDRVKDWITHNEPWCSGMQSHEKGIHAPGKRSFPEALAACHHLLLSHGWSVPIIRGNCKNAEVGITLNLTPSMPASKSAADYDANRHFDGYFNRWFLDPVYGRRYPADMLADYGAKGYLDAANPAFVKPGDFEAMAAPTDFLGVNYYSRAVIRSEAVPEAENLPREVELAPKSEWTEMGWEVYPDGLRQILSRVYLTYGPRKLYITENGASYSEGPNGNGHVPDERRRKYLRDHFVAARKAIDEGVPLEGYFVWSLMDNFEWDRGYTQRFGIVWVDYKSLERTPKDSALWYKSVIAENAFGE